MNDENLLRLWQWLSVTSAAAAATVVSTLQDGKISLLPLLSDRVTGAGASIYGAAYLGALVFLHSAVGAQILRSRLYLPRRQRFPELFGFKVALGKPFDFAVPFVSWILFCACPLAALANCVVTILRNCSLACLEPGRDTYFTSDGQYGILHGGSQAALICAIILCAIFGSLWFHLLLIPPRRLGVRGWLDHVTADVSFPFGWPWSPAVKQNPQSR